MSVDTDIIIDEKIVQINKEPNKFNVVMINDNFTPIDWVIQILRTIYKHSQEAAEKITLTIHNDGSAVVGTYAYEIAEQKALETVNSSRAEGFPLQVKLEESYD